MSKRIIKDYGMSDYYKYYKSNTKNTKVNSIKYNQIISEFNSSVINLIINESLEYKLPKLSMTLCVRKIKKVPRIENGKLINTNPVDWKSTLELWNNDPEAKEKKILLKHTNYHTFKNIFRIKLIKFGVFYKNKRFFKFKPVRSFQRALGKRINNPDLENFDAYQLY